MPTLAYYVSGHGFGHARRSAQVLRALRARRGDLDLLVRTAAPASIFAGIEGVRVSAPEPDFDSGVVERDLLSIDGAASMRRLAETLSRRAELVAAEAAFLRESGASFVAADIPFLAADAAEAAGLRSVAVGNFTWDWIFEPYATAATRPLIDAIRESYGKMDGLLQLPLAHGVDCFRAVTPVPLVAGQSTADRAETLGRLGLDAADRRPRVLVAVRGGISREVLVDVAKGAADLVFVAVQRVDGAPANLKCVDGGRVDFTDLLAACDAVVSKVGYGILSDCMANGVALLYPPRVGFREDEISVEQSPRFMRMRGLPAADFAAGRWAPHLTALLDQPAPPARAATDEIEEALGRLDRVAVQETRDPQTAPDEDALEELSRASGLVEHAVEKVESIVAEAEPQPQPQAQPKK
jgi:L-arabinokinase